MVKINSLTINPSSPVWAPLIVSSFSAEEVKTFGSTAPMARAGHPFELAPAYVFLANDDQVILQDKYFMLTVAQ